MSTPGVEAFLRLEPPDYLLCGPVNYAMLQACIRFTGRDRRRIKREMNKAAERARKDRQK